MGRLRYFSFGFALMMMPTAVSASKPHNCFVIAAADSQAIAQVTETRPFGNIGKDGQTGGTGKNAPNADNLTIFSDGTALNLNMAGKDGENGQKGGDAIASDCQKQPNQADVNLRAADGANGGNGGNGGDGGNGGSITIYATNPANLRQIFVSAAGGKGGQPGQGGLASAGCNCTVPYWTIETCSGSPGSSDYRCSTREFRCTNGRNGVNGNAGLSGREGLPGKLTVINLNKPLETDKPSATVSMTTLKDQGYTLSKNRWETRQGARNLLAPGSVITDEYLALVERTERSFLLIWNAPQPFSNFADKNVTLSLNDQQEINVTLPDDLWLEGTTQKRNDVTEFLVYNAISAGDATRLEEVALLGNGTELQLILRDTADKSNLVATKFKIKYSITQSDPRYRPPSDYSMKYTGDIPDNLVSLNGDRFVLNIGQLPIPPEFLKPGLGVQMELLATRTFSGYQASQKLWVTDIISTSRAVPGSTTILNNPGIPQNPAIPNSTITNPTTLPNNSVPLPNNLPALPNTRPSVPSSVPFPGSVSPAPLLR